MATLDDLVAAKDMIWRVREELKHLQAENERLKGNLEHISTCLTIMKNTQSEEGIKDLPKLAETLQEYVAQALKGE